MTTTSMHPPAILHGSATAPILTFDHAPLFGIVAGTYGLTLTAVVHDRDADGNACQRQVVVAHLRGTPSGFAELHRGIEQLGLLMSPPPDTPAN